MAYEIPVLKICGGSYTKAEIKSRLAVIDQIIAAYELALLTNAPDSMMVEYEIHTGQTKQRVKVSEPQQMILSLAKLQSYRDLIASKLKPRVTRLIHVKSFKNC